METAALIVFVPADISIKYSNISTCSHPNSQERVNVDGASPFENCKDFLARYGMFVILSILKRCIFAIDFDIAIFDFDLVTADINHDFKHGATFLGEDTIGWSLSTMTRDKGPLGISLVFVGHVVVGTNGFTGGNTWA